MITIESYSEIIFPLIKHCCIESQSKEYQKDHLWYLYRQAFYGYGMFQDKNLYSENAFNKFNELYAKYLSETTKRNKIPKILTIEGINWSEQPLIDKKREELLFEHMYTGTMFREDITRLYHKGNLDVTEISKLIRLKYKICLITKEENLNLHKTHRGFDPVEYYQSIGGIKILNLKE